MPYRFWRLGNCNVLFFTANVLELKAPGAELVPTAGRFSHPDGTCGSMEAFRYRWGAPSLRCDAHPTSPA